MSYESALESAGAEVIKFSYFGSYQGDWWAKVEYLGSVGWVKGSYGSCSGCDAYEGEFFNFFGDYSDRPEDPEFKEAVRQFGLRYLNNCWFTQEEAEKEASSNIDWDVEAQKMLDFIKCGN